MRELCGVRRVAGRGDSPASASRGPERAVRAVGGGRRREVAPPPQEAAGFDAQTALASRNSEDVGFYPRSDSLVVMRVRGKAGSESWLALGQGGSHLLRRPRDPSGGPRAMTGKSPGGGRVLVVR